MRERTGSGEDHVVKTDSRRREDLPASKREDGSRRKEDPSVKVTWQRQQKISLENQS